MSWPTRASIPINSLYYSCIQNLNNYNPLNCKPLNYSNSSNNDSQQLPLQIRQQIIEYFVRERIETNVDLICELLNGGLNYFDLWSLCEINSYHDIDVYKIIDQLTLNSSNLIELNIGGPEWIYNTELVNGPLMNLFREGNLKKLRNLKLQQVNDDEMLYEILVNCTNLIKLEIKEPSITDHHIGRIVDRFTGTEFKLQELNLPSSVRNNGLFDCFRMFTSLRSLSMSNFEPVLDYLDQADQLNYNEQYINQLKKQLKQLNKLTISNPMGSDACEHIARYCPNINELNLEIQEIMHLKPICKLKSLKSLSLHNSPNLPTSFANSILPILEKIGHQFISLSLEQFDVLDLVEINKLCPILHTFSAQWFTLLSVGRSSTFRLFNDAMFAMAAAQTITTKKCKDDFANLRLLRLRPRLNRNLSSLAIEYLIRNAKQLHYLELYCCKQIDDALFRKWFKLNGGFKELRYLIIRHCNDLNRKTIARLLVNSSNLMYLELDKPVLNKTELLPASDDPIDLNLIL